jgi:DNA helicase INO80
MSGAPPYGVHSPNQQPPYTAYSPPSKNRPYYPNGEQYQQHPPETPQTFPPPSSFTRSPHFGHPPSPLSTTLPPLNGSAPPHSDASPSYQTQHSSSATPNFPLPRPYPSSVMSGTSAAPYGQPTTSHAHPSSRPDALSQSPKKEPESVFSSRGNGAGYSSHSPMMRPPSPKESVCFFFLLLLYFASNASVTD